MIQDVFCRRCKLSSLRSSVCVWGTGTRTQADVLVVKEAVDKAEDKTDSIRPLIALEGYRVATTVLVKCMPFIRKFKPKPTTKGERESCKPYFDEEYRTCKPKLLILTGGPVIKHFFPKLSAELARGEIHEHMIYGPCLCTYNPWQAKNNPTVARLLQQDLELARKFLATGQIQVSSVYGEKVIVSPTRDELASFWGRAQNAPWVASDLETADDNGPSVRYFADDFYVTHAGFCLPDGTGVTFDPDLHPEYYEWLCTLPQVVHNSGFEGSIFPKNTKVLADTLVLGHLRNPELPRGLEFQARTYVGHVKWKGNERTWDDWARRNAVDIHVTAELYKSHTEALDPARLRLHDEVVLPAALIYGELYKRGVPLSPENQRTLEREMEEWKDALKREAWEKYYFPPAGNLNSPSQVAEFMYKRLGIEPPEKAYKEGAEYASTDKEILKDLVVDHPFCEVVMNYRRAQKFQSNYVYEGYPDLKRFPILPCGTVTGRPSMKDGGQTAARDKCVRRNYVPSHPDFVLLSGDLSQAELRIAAGELARCPVLTQIYRDGLDVHDETCRNVMGQDPSIKEMRSRAKPVNFGLLYGAGPDTLQKIALVEYGVRFTLAEATAVRDAWMRRYYGIPRWHGETLREILLNGEIRSPLGRWWPFFGAKTAKGSERKLLLNRALDYPDQGTSSDCTLIGLKAAYDLCPSFPILTLHDQVYGEIHKDDREDFQWEWKKLWEKRMAEYHDWTVPMVVDLSWGASLGDLVGVKL